MTVFHRAWVLLACGALAAAGDGTRGDQEALLVALAALFLLGVALVVLRKLRRDARGADTGEPAPALAGAPRLYTDLGLYRRLLREARPYWPHIGVIFLLSLLATPIALLTPLPLKLVVDNVLGDEPLPGFLETVLPANTTSERALLVVTVALVLAVALVRQAHELTLSLLRTLASERLLLRFRGRLFGQAQRLSLAYHDTKGSADAVYRIQYDATAIQRIAVDGIIPLLASLLTLIGMIYVTALLDPELALVALGVCPFLIAVTVWYRTRVRRRYKEVKRLESGALSVVQEVFGALRVVKAFGQEDREEARYLVSARGGMRARLRVALMEGAFGLVVGLTIAAGTGAVLYVGVRHVQDGTLSLGSLLLIMGYLTQLYEPLRTLSKKAASLQSALVSAERAYALLDEAPDVPERPDARHLERARGAVDFEDVEFAYPGCEPVLHDVTLSVQPGTRVGIAGATGAGKSTLVSLLSRFYDPTRGRIQLDGVDLRDYRVADLRNQFAIVLQEPVLFSTSIRENIAYARPEASDDEIIGAARAANAHDFIVALPDGYETLVGERGMRLSGGERQRIGLARAFLKDAPILVLDEPTSSVDVKTEAGIMDAMQRLMQGRTTFMIAHRLSTLAHCDARLTISAGRVMQALPADGSRRQMTRTIVGARSLVIPRATRPNRSIHKSVRRAQLMRRASQAWVELTGDRCDVEIIKCKSKSGICRLRNTSGRTVIAKWCRADVAARERVIYEHALPQASLPSLRVHGMTETEAGFRWIFLEDAGDQAYLGADKAHREAALRWLSGLHAADISPLLRTVLPHRDATAYRDHLRSAQAELRSASTYRHLGPADRVVVNAAIASCAQLEGVWPLVEAVCAEIPRVLIHGDFVPKNMRVRAARPHGVEILALDWETAGLGPALVDLAGHRAPDDLALYTALPIGSLDPRAFKRVAAAGATLRYAAAFDWAASSLRHAHSHRPLAQLNKYVAEVEQPISELRGS